MEEVGKPDDAAKLALDSLFANLMVMITQTLVHAFVHWHRGERELADATWEMSGAAMMHATGIVNSLAPHHVAPDPARAVVRGDVALPRVAATRPDALANDRRLAERVSRRGEPGRRRPAGRGPRGRLRPDRGLVRRARRLATGPVLPRIDNPCVDFERVLREYVWSGRPGSASLA